MTEHSELFFVYGTLTDPDRVARVVSDYEFLGGAVLEGLHQIDAEYPTLAPGGTAPGRVLRTPEVEALDAYEGVATGLYVRVSVPLVGGESGDDFAGESTADAGEREVAVYVGDSDALGADVEWPGPEPFPAAVERFCRENEVVVRPRPR